MSEPWRINLFGSLRAQRGERIVTRFKTQKVASLFAYLAFHLRQAHSREILMEMLWPESDALTLRNSLSVALSSLRHQFEPPGIAQGTVLRADRFSVGLNPVTVTTDVAEFEQALKAAAKADSAIERAQHLTRAVELYQGQLLPGFYEVWIPAEQERLMGQFFDAVGTLVGHLESIGDTNTALSHARYAVAVDPLREEGRQHLIRLLAADGQPGAALRQYKDYERVLYEEIGEEPSTSLRALFRQIEKVSGPYAPAAVPAVVPRKRVPPTPASSIVPATVTFLMTDIEGGTRLFQQAPEAYTAAREQHHTLLRQEFSRHGGQEVQDTGDGFVVAFPTAGSALACALAAQQALAAETWPKGIEPLLVRMALHTGDVRQSSEDGQYQGIALHHASRMLTAAHGGQTLVSDATASLAQGASEAGIRLVDLGVYRLRDVPETKRLFQVEYPDMRLQDFGPLAAESGHKANVPPRFNRFFGREQEIAQLREMLVADSVRLVTVTGPAGNGKTRLALEVAERMAEPLAGAVYFVPLADLNDPALIAGAILESLGVGRAPQKEPLEQAVEALSAKPTLLVMDNFEHLIEGGADAVQTLLTRVASLTLLITSRQLLGLSAEHEFMLLPLPVPATEESPEQLSLYDSVQLFIDRAQQVMPYFQVNNANAAAVAALVGGLEGIPLAIELAAARVQVLSPAQMLSQLSHRLDFLASRKRDVGERQRTLRGALDWSYRLLAPELQRFFSRLSVFRGGWSVEAAEQVCEEPLALDYLEQLRECSLVLADEPTGESIRFRMLETLREYGQGRLGERRETEAVRGRLVSHLLALAEGAAPRLTGPEQGEALSLLHEEHDNFRNALAACSEGAGTADAGLRICGALWRFWVVRGHFSEGRRWCAWALGRAEGAGRTRARAMVLNGAGTLAWRQSEYGVARALYEECLDIRRELEDRQGIAASLGNLGSVALHHGDLTAARALYDESLAIARELGERRGIAQALNNLGLVSYTQGDYTAARLLHEESLAIRREIGDLNGIAASLGNLGLVAHAQGDLKAAQVSYEESLATSRELGEVHFIAHCLKNLGRVAHAQSNDVEARTLYCEGFAISRAVGDRRGIAYSLVDFGVLAAAAHQTERAARLWGAAEALRENIGAPLLVREREELEREVASLRTEMGEKVLDAAWEAGRSMGWEAAVAQALE
jgi:predicted ATPase/DNA-binding SARP family transcriptional activator/Tfp pilus assembly protein PilF